MNIRQTNKTKRIVLQSSYLGVPVICKDQIGVDRVNRISSELGLEVKVIMNVNQNITDCHIIDEFKAQFDNRESKESFEKRKYFSPTWEIIKPKSD